MLRLYRVRIGDTLSSISQKFYGTPDFWDYIYQHNLQQIADPNQLTPLQSIAIPHLHADTAVEHVLKRVLR